MTPVAGSPFAAGTEPESVAVDRTGKFAYVANSQSNSAKVNGGILAVSGNIDHISQEVIAVDRL